MIRTFDRWCERSRCGERLPCILKELESFGLWMCPACHLVLVSGEMSGSSSPPVRYLVVTYDKYELSGIQGTIAMHKFTIQIVDKTRYFQKRPENCEQ